MSEGHADENTTHNLLRIDEEDNSITRNDLNESSNYNNSYTQVALTSKITKSPVQSASKLNTHDGRQYQLDIQVSEGMRLMNNQSILV